MGNMTFTEFQAELLIHLGNRNNVETYKGEWINRAYLSLVSRKQIFGVPMNFRFPGVETSTSTNTVDGTAYIAAPTDALVVTHVHDATSDKKLTNISWDEYIKKTGRATAASEGAPTDWVRYGANLYLHKTPDAVYAMTVYYRKRPTELTGSAVTVLGAEWDEVILLLAAIQSHIRVNDLQPIEIKKEEWKEMVLGMIGLHAFEQFDRKDVRSPSPAYLDGFKYR